MRKSISWMILSLMAICLTVPSWAQEVVFEDDFDGNAGDAPNGAKWNVILDKGSIALDGQGRLVMTGVESWNAAVLESQFAIPGKGEDAYEVEYRIIAPEYAAHYIGLSSAAGAVGPIHHRAFLLQGSTPSFKNPKGINLTTSISGQATGVLSSDLGIASDAGEYPRQGLPGLILPLANLFGVDLELAGQLAQGLLPPDRLDNDTGFERRRKPPALSCHRFLSVPFHEIADQPDHLNPLSSFWGVL